jgi:hypothetical protein
MYDNSNKMAVNKSKVFENVNAQRNIVFNF